MKKYSTAVLILGVSLTSLNTPMAQAGPLRWAVERVGQKWATHRARQQAARESYREIGRLEAKRAAQEAAKRRAKWELTRRNIMSKAGKVISIGGFTFTTGMLIGSIAKAGYKKNPVPLEQRSVERELALAAANGAPIYKARVCLHPETKEFYTVPKWAKVCADGKPVHNGNAIDLQALRKAARKT